MFTGIVKGIGNIAAMEPQAGLLRYSVALPSALVDGVEIGASIAIDGICQTVVAINGHEIFFDAIEETLQRTTLSQVCVGARVNIERSARIGDEIGGHLLSGHVFGTVRITAIDAHRLTFTCDPTWTKYLFPKGFVALNGCSLTLVDVNRSGTFTVHLIPETLRRTTFAQKQVGDLINIEFDALTQAAVDTVLRMALREGLLGTLGTFKEF